nr:hypothetical protein [Tanacetum cinerariifolium]
MGRDIVQLETVVNTIFHEYLLEFTSEYGIPKVLHPELPGPEDRIVDFPKGKVGSVPNRRGLANECSQRQDTGREHVLRGSREGTGYTPYPHLETAGDATLLSRNKPQILPRDEVYPTFLHDDDRGGYGSIQFNSGPKSYKVKIGSRPRAPHEVPLLTLTANRVIEMDDPAVATDSSGVPSTIERSPLDFAHEAGTSDQETVAPEMPPSEDVPATDAPGAGQAEEVAVTGPPAATESRKRGRDGIDVNAPPKTLNHAIRLISPRDPESENASSPFAIGSPESLYWPEWGVSNGSLLDTPEACQDLVDHVAPPGYFFELRHLHNDEFLRQYNVNLTRQVAMGSQLCLRFEQEAKLLRKSVAQLARRDKRIQARELEIKNLEALLEVATLQEQVSGEEKLKAAFEEFKRSEDDRVEQQCAEMEARLDALSIDFDEELYPHMLTAIAGRRWVIGRGMRLAMMKCGESLELRQVFADVISAGIAKGISEGLRHRVEHGQAQLSLESIETYDPEAKTKYVTALQALKDLKYPLVDQLEGLKDAPMDVIMAALYLESDTGGDALQYICDFCPSSSQLTIPVYPKVRDPRNP